MRKGGRQGRGRREKRRREEGRKDQKIIHKPVNHSSPKVLPP